MKAGGVFASTDLWECWAGNDGRIKSSGIPVTGASDTIRVVI